MHGGRKTEDGGPWAAGWAVALSCVIACLAGLAAWWRVEHPAESEGMFTVADRRGCPIFIAAEPTPEEMRAAKLIQRTLARATGRPAAQFPILIWNDEARPRRGIRLAPAGGAMLAEKAAFTVSSQGVVIHGEPADAIGAATAWFLEKAAGARWFMPGELGEEVPRQNVLRLPFGRHGASPSFVSRNLGLHGSEAEREWWRRNRLRAVLKHGHAMADLFRPEDVRANPEFASMFLGRREFPAKELGGNWQPNLVAPGAAEHAAGVLARRDEESSAIGMNDSIHYDQSEETLRRVGGFDGLTAGGPRWFRDKPDYSDLVFGFVNDVARRLPERLLGAYAYDWTEDAPRFPVENNVVPWLTADRSQWFDPAFAAQDRDLIKRWVAAGPGMVAIYDYYYGSPFFVPRPTLYAVTQGIPFAHQAGVRAFYAETFANWGLDGPKAWLAAQLLWDAEQESAALLDTYYREFWREAAEPMRRFFELCDSQWLGQPPPSYWLKYYKDEHQHLLFPREVREELSALLREAEAAARTRRVRERVEFVQAAWAVADAFCAMCEARDGLSRLAFKPVIDAAAVREAWSDCVATRRRLDAAYAETKARHPLAVNATLLMEYTRNDPRPRAAFRLASEAQGQGAGLDFAGFSAPAAVATPVRGGSEVLADASLSELRINPPAGFTDFEWVAGGAWRGYGEPYRTRRITLEPASHGNAVRLSGCKGDSFYQWQPAVPGARYVARVKVRGKVSPGNMTFLILNFGAGEKNTPGHGQVDRLPVGDYPEGVELITWAIAPKDARQVGMGVRVLNQVNDDYAVCEGFSLQRVD